MKIQLFLVNILIVVVANVAYAWDTQTHRAIEHCALTCKSPQSAYRRSGNLHTAMYNLKSNTTSYEYELFDDYIDHQTKTPITYFDYITQREVGEKFGISAEGHIFSNYDYIDMIEAGSILEDSLWEKINADIDYGYQFIRKGYGRFNMHFYDVNNNGNGLNGLPTCYKKNTSLLEWAFLDIKQQAEMYYAPSTGNGVCSQSFHNNYYSFYNALDYFKKSIKEKKPETRGTNQAKLLVSIGFLLHLLNDTSVPAHMRNDSHPIYEPLEIYMKGGSDRNHSFGFRMANSTLSNYNSKSIINDIEKAVSTKEISYKSFFENSANFTGQNFFSSDTIDISENINKHPNISDLNSFNSTDEFITSKNIILDSRPLKLMSQTITSSYPHFPQENTVKFLENPIVLEEYGRILIPKAVANTDGFINYFFRGNIFTNVINNKLRVYNISDPSLVKSKDMTYFRTGSSFHIFYDSASGDRTEITSLQTKLKHDFLPGQFLEIPIPDNNLSDFTRYPERITVYFEGEIGNEEGYAATFTAAIKQDTDTDGIPDAWEIAHGLNMFDSEDFMLDRNNNGINNLQEFWDEDTDEDGFSNLEEQKRGSNYFNDNSKPLSAPQNFKVIDIQTQADLTKNITLQWDSLPNAIGYIICDSSWTFTDKPYLWNKGCPMFNDGNLSFPVYSTSINTNINTAVINIKTLSTDNPTHYFTISMIDTNKVQGMTSQEIVASIIKPKLNVQVMPTDSQITITWSLLSNTSSYGICYAETTITDPDNCNGMWLDNQNSPTTINNLTNGKTYHLVVTAQGKDGQLAHSEEAIATPQITAPISSCPKSVKSVVFKETFDDSILDSAKWDMDETGGIVLLSNGKITMTGAGYNSFPVVQTKTNPFPTSGNYSFYCKAKYNSLKLNGSGACVAVQKMIKNGTQSLAYESGSTLQLWADTSLGGSLWRTASRMYGGDEYLGYKTPNDLEDHSYETCIIGSQAIAYKDGVKVAETTLPNTWVTPNKIWLGNPVTGNAGYPWSSFETDTIEVRKLEDGIDPTGWIYNETTKHYYKALDNCGNWEQCEAVAQSLGSHLVMLEDPVEQTWVLTNFGRSTNQHSFFIGLTDKGYQDNDWRWISGEVPAQSAVVDSGAPWFRDRIDYGFIDWEWGWWSFVSQANESQINRAVVERPNPPNEPNIMANPFTVQANDEVGSSFTVPTGKTQCTFNATGMWNVHPSSTYLDANGSNSMYEANKILPSAPLMALIARRDIGQFEFVGSSGSLSVKSGETLHFLGNDAVGALYNNSGSLSVSWICQ